VVLADDDVLLREGLASLLHLTRRGGLAAVTRGSDWMDDRATIAHSRGPVCPAGGQPHYRLASWNLCA
jgi:hypothetical protein